MEQGHKQKNMKSGDSHLALYSLLFYHQMYGKVAKPVDDQWLTVKRTKS